MRLIKEGGVVMDYDFENALNDLSEFLKGPVAVGLGQKSRPVAYIFLSPGEVLDCFIRVYPKHKRCRSKLLEQLAKTTHVENGLMAVRRASALAAAM